MWVAPVVGNFVQHVTASTVDDRALNLIRTYANARIGITHCTINMAGTGHQPPDRQSARPRSAADAARTRRRGDRMKLPHRRQFLHLAAGAAALPAMSRMASAQAYPARILK